MDSDFTTGNRTVDRMSRINITGNIIPAAWYKTIRKSTGKPYLNAIVILSDIVYWYRAAEIRDEGSGQLIGFRKRFHSDLLQRSYQQLADQFGISKRDANNAVVELEKLGVIRRVFRTLCINGQQVPNVLFLDLDVEVLLALTYPAEELCEETTAEQKSGGYPTKISDTPGVCAAYHGNKLNIPLESGGGYHQNTGDLQLKPVGQIQRLLQKITTEIIPSYLIRRWKNGLRSRLSMEH